MSEPHSHSAKLSSSDAEALDALVKAGFDPAAVPTALRKRAEKLASLLGQLNTGPASLEADAVAAARRAALVDATLARVLCTPTDACESPSVARPSATLCEADADAVDALVTASWNPGKVSSANAERAQRASSLLGALEHSQTDVLDDRNREDLIAATLARISREEHRRALASPEPALVSRSRFALTDLVSLAAMILIAISVVWPTLTATREHAKRQAGQSNLAGAGLGFSMYANDHDGELPKAQRSTSSQARWWNVGEPGQSHSANLFVLVTSGYVTLSELSCPGNATAPIHLDLSAHKDWRAHEEVSFSYQLFGEDRPMWKTPVRVLVVVDKSPVVERARRGERFDSEMGSFNHMGLGQNALFSDGSVEWLGEPNLDSGDNIWLPRWATGDKDAQIKGVEKPADARDVFVGP